MSAEETQNKRKAYTPPKLIRHGSVSELTTGGSMAMTEGDMINNPDAGDGGTGDPARAQAMP